MRGIGINEDISSYCHASGIGIKQVRVAVEQESALNIKLTIVYNIASVIDMHGCIADGTNSAGLLVVDVTTVLHNRLTSGNDNCTVIDDVSVDDSIGEVQCSVIDDRTAAVHVVNFYNFSFIDGYVRPVIYIHRAGCRRNTTGRIGAALSQTYHLAGAYD